MIDGVCFVEQSIVGATQVPEVISLDTNAKHAYGTRVQTTVQCAAGILQDKRDVVRAADARLRTKCQLTQVADKGLHDESAFVGVTNYERKSLSRFVCRSLG